MDSKAESAVKAANKTTKAVKKTDYDYDLVVIGSGPSGQRAAIQAAKIGKRAAVIERAREIGRAHV